MTFNTLQLLRFIAASLVLLLHLGFIHSGYKGVDLFFVISGFVMYYALFYKARPVAIKFVSHRLTKIFFVYWFSLLLLYLIQPFNLRDGFYKTVLLIPGHQSVIGVSWSLSYELYFYFLVGTVAYCFKESLCKKIFLLLFLISSFITLINLTSYTFKGSVLNFLAGNNFWEFLLGITSGFISLTYHKKIQPATALVVSILSCLLYLLTAIPYTNPLSYVVYGLFSFLAVLFFTAYEKNKTVKCKIARVFKILGDASYCIYLFGPIITLLMPTTSVSYKLIIFISTIIFSVFFNQLVEKQFLSWLRKMIDNRYSFA